MLPLRSCNLRSASRVLVANAPMRLKCAGAVSGEVEVDDAGTIGALVDALERKAGVEPGKLKVIAGGKTILPGAATTPSFRRKSVPRRAWS